MTLHLVASSSLQILLYEFCIYDYVCISAGQLDLNPAFAVITGGPSHAGTERSYPLAKQYIAELQELDGPVIPLMENMDHRTNFGKTLFMKPPLTDNASLLLQSHHRRSPRNHHELPDTGFYRRLIDSLTSFKGEHRRVCWSSTTRDETKVTESLQSNQSKNLHANDFPVYTIQ